MKKLLALLLLPFAASAQYFEQSGGEAVIEAENFDRETPSATHGSWSTVTDGTYSGGEGIKSPGLTGIEVPPDSAVVEYDICVDDPSVTYIWARVFSEDTGSDSLFVEIDNLGPLQLNTGSANLGTLVWVRQDYTEKGPLTVGAHVLKIHRREPRNEVDKIIFTTDGSFTPTGAGPAESASVSCAAPANSPPVLAGIGGVDVPLGETTTINMSATDPDGDGVTFSDNGTKPSWCTLTDNLDNTAKLDCTPSASDIGPHQVTITITDDGVGPPANLTDSETFTITAGQTLAFPSAMGYGRFASGGRNGIVCHVDTLSTVSTGGPIDGGPHHRGSFKYCFDALTVPRTIVFDVGGKISWTGQHGRTGAATGDVTVACHTAPGADGIVFAGQGHIFISKSNVIMRFCRLRSTEGSYATLRFGEDGLAVNNIIVDHTSMLWDGDATVGWSGGINGWQKINCNQTGTDSFCVTDFTVQYSIIGQGGGYSEGSGNGWGGGSKCLGMTANARGSVIRTLVSNCGRRMPMAADGSIEWINNIFYNSMGSEGPGEYRAYWDDGLWSVIGNAWYRGPQLPTAPGPGFYNLGDCSTCVAKMFLKGNRHAVERPNDVDYAETCIFDNSGAPPSCTMGFSRFQLQSTPPLPGMYSENDPIVLTAEQALTLLAADDGALTNIGPHIPKYSYYDAFEIAGLKSIISTSDPAVRVGDCQVLSGPKPACLTRPLTESDAQAMAVGIQAQTASRPAGFDSDWDGIPDSWETANGLNPFDENDGAVTASNGYTYLENYINELAGDEVSFGPTTPVSNQMYLLLREQ